MNQFKLTKIPIRDWNWYPKNQLDARIGLNSLKSLLGIETKVEEWIESIPNEV